MMFSRPLRRTASVRLAGSEAVRARLTSLLSALMTTASELGLPGGSEDARRGSLGCSAWERLCGAAADAARVSAFLSGVAAAGAELEVAAVLT
eukprot:15465967-Alexandrium_andersonii.AAC.1